MRKLSLRKIKNPLPCHITSWLHGWTLPDYTFPALNDHIPRINGEYGALNAILKY